MKTLKFLVLFTTIFSLVIVSSCKKDDDSSPNNNAEQYETKTVEIPEAMAQSSDPGAQEATAYLNMVNSMSTYGSMMTPPSKSTPVNYKDGGTEVYTWEVNEGMNNYTATLTIIETPTMYSWQMSINGTIDGHTFTNFTYISAESGKDGMHSSITLYEFDGSGIAMTMSWQDNGNGSSTFNFEVPNSIRLTVGVNADGSGWIEVFEWNGTNYYLDFRIEWNASGHGEWWEYVDGVVSDHGNW